MVSQADGSPEFPVEKRRDVAHPSHAVLLFFSATSSVSLFYLVGLLFLRSCFSQESPWGAHAPAEAMPQKEAAKKDEAMLAVTEAYNLNHRPCINL